MGSLLKLLSDLSPQHKLQLGLAWAASLLLVAVVTWGLAALFLGGAESAGPDEPAVIAQVEQESGEATGTGNQPPPAAKRPDSGTGTEPTSSPPPSEPVSSREGPAPRPRPTPPRPTPVEPKSVGEAQSAEAPTESGTVLLDRVLACARLYRSDEVSAARDDARALLAEYSSASALSNAMIEEDVNVVRADLLALRILQISGRDEESREVARQLRQSHADDSEVADTIRLWKILRPRVASVESGVGRGGEIVVSGTVENPDVASVRRVRVLIEGVDDQGNLVRTIEVRVRPKLLGSTATGTFEGILKGSDLATIVRTRASVSDFQYEVVNP